MNTILFDLSDTLVRGLHGVEDIIAPLVGQEHESILPQMYGGTGVSGLNVGSMLYRLNLGEITEIEYLNDLLKRTQWPIDVVDIQDAIRSNFLFRVNGFTNDTLSKLSSEYRLVLVSDHAREWAPFVLSHHPFINEYFKDRYFSFEMSITKKSKSFFERVLQDIGANANDCLFVDDSQSNLDVAATAGITGVIFTGLSTVI